jgi:hypothetical protein
VFDVRSPLNVWMMAIEVIADENVCRDAKHLIVYYSDRNSSRRQRAVEIARNLKAIGGLQVG